MNLSTETIKDPKDIYINKQDLEYTLEKQLKTVKTLHKQATKDIKEPQDMQHTAHHTFLFILVEHI